MTMRRRKMNTSDPINAPLPASVGGSNYNFPLVNFLLPDICFLELSSKLIVPATVGVGVAGGRQGK